LLLEIEGGGLADQAQGHWPDFTDAGDLLEFGNWSVQDGTETAEAIQECFGAGLHVPAWNAQCKEQLDNLVFGKACKATSEESSPQAPTVAAVMRDCRCSLLRHGESRSDDGTKA
jgi:hypothetical protein